MLDELKNLEYHGGKDELLFFIRDVIGYGEIKIRDAEVICSHASGKWNLSVADLISYCLAFGWVKVVTDIISLSPSLATYVSDTDELNEKLIRSTVEQLFIGEVFSPYLFSYDVVKDCYAFKNEFFPLSFSTVRNMLIGQGFLIIKREMQGTRFYVAPTYDSVIAKHCKERHKQISLERLKKQLETNEIAGEKAELFVLSFEKERIGEPLCHRIKRISEIDVSAGYDIVSFESRQSLEPDRFIEVKAVSGSGFYWSKNEFEIAKLKGELYYLYLVELGHIDEMGYVPEVIQNPVVNIMESDDWFVETQSYHIKRI